MVISSVGFSKENAPEPQSHSPLDCDKILWKMSQPIRDYIFYFCVDDCYLQAEGRAKLPYTCDYIDHSFGPFCLQALDDYLSAQQVDYFMCIDSSNSANRENPAINNNQTKDVK